MRGIIEQLRTNPHDRRMLLTAWNPADIPKMALPPCHCLAQFYVNDRKELSCQLYQRSADMGLGVPYNIASYSLLTHMIARVTGLKAGEFIHTLGDYHIYLNHIGALCKQLERQPRPFPKLRIDRSTDNIDEFQAEDFVLIDYDPHGTLPMRMAV